MKFLKQIKGKVLATAFLNGDKQKQKSKQIIREQGKDEKQVTAQSFAKSLLNDNRNGEKSENKEEVIKKIDGGGRIWRVASPTNLEINNQSIKQGNGIKQEYNTDEQGAAFFITNLCNSVAELEKERRLKVIKAKNAIFGKLQVQPIYMVSHCQYKILSMQLETKHELRIERTQELVLQKSVLDRTIQNTLISGYLWEVYGLPNKLFIQSCYETVASNSRIVSEQYGNVIKLRSKLKLFLCYFMKISNLNNRRVIIAKKLKLLSKIKSYKKNIQLQFSNIDQAFFIQRSRQKLFNHLMRQQKLMNKLKLLQNMLKKIYELNEKIKYLIQNQLSKWIDGGHQVERKQVQKLLILLYFVKTQKMYINNGVVIRIDEIKNKDKLIEEINGVKKWEEYKYVNDKHVKIKVTEFLDAFLKQLEDKQCMEQSANGKTTQKIQMNVVGKLIEEKGKY